MNYKSDAQLHREILQELEWDTRVDETEVGVQVEKGIVTLTGTVSCLAKSIAAQEAAHRVEGVLDVANDIVVHVKGVGIPNDTEIAQAVRNALRWNVFVHDASITSTVHEGVVTLEGSADSIQSRREAELAVQPIHGVRRVVSRIIIRPRAVTPVSIRETITGALRRRANTAAHGVSVHVTDHDVTLEGAVPSWTEKQAILDAAGHMRGIAKVVDHLRVDPMMMNAMAR